MAKPEPAGRLAVALQVFTRSCGIMLALTAAAKIVSGMGSKPILSNIDPILSIPFRPLLFLVAGAELCVAAVLFMRLSATLKLTSILWLASAFLVYRILSAKMGVHFCPCLGTLGDNLPFSHAFLDGALRAVLGYMFVGSLFFLTALQLSPRVPWDRRPANDLRSL